MISRPPSNEIDHVVLPFASLDEARGLFTKLGFTVAPDAVHPFGTGNACVFFADGTYFEPLAIADPAAYEAAKSAGNLFVARDAGFRSRHGLPSISAIAFRSADALGDRASLAEKGVGEVELVEFSRNFRTPAGEDASVSFRLAFARAEPDPHVSFFFCQPLHAKAPDRSALTRHPNGVSGLARIVLSAHSPDKSRELLTAVSDARADKGSHGGLCFDLANTMLHVISDTSLVEEYGAEPNPSGGLCVRGIVLSVSDMAATRACLAAGGCSPGMIGGRLVVPFGADGSFIAFEESPV
ncbi:MAG TPA: VOC family protein [Aurantimonas coralicida]|uniref:VOC family protein n=2 Tax=root TaxID=1 RepID=A0A9C9NH38_9HYPH|nr:VOC family protein [Aurantimonas coralicida]HEU01612.1 VOC family protein [Aurantimonas coralicida]